MARFEEMDFKGYQRYVAGDSAEGGPHPEMFIQYRPADLLCEGSPVLASSHGIRPG
jgi:hypothetical protein